MTALEKVAIIVELTDLEARCAARPDSQALTYAHYFLKAARRCLDKDYPRSWIRANMRDARIYAGIVAKND